jgi:hypothetical protein
VATADESLAAAVRRDCFQIEDRKGNAVTDAAALQRAAVQFAADPRFAHLCKPVPAGAAAKRAAEKKQTLAIVDARIAALQKRIAAGKLAGDDLTAAQQTLKRVQAKAARLRARMNKAISGARKAEIAKLEVHPCAGRRI